MLPVSDGSRALAERTQKAPAHVLAIAETGFDCDRLDRYSFLLQHQSNRLKSKALDRSSGRMSSFHPEDPAELPRTEPCQVR
jgi:hypothetical protein